MNKSSGKSTKLIIARTGTILATVFGLGACTTQSGPVLAPINIKDGTTIPAARLSWRSDGPDTKPGASNFGVELEYAQGTGSGDQHLGANEHVSLGGASLLGPQDVHHRADLRYGHVAASGTTRFSRRASRLELQWVAGLGQTRLNLRSESRTAGSPAIGEKYQNNGLALGIGLRWNIRDELAAEGRAQVLWAKPHSGDDFWYPEVALRYRPLRNAALRLGYSGMGYRPAKQNGGSSPVEVRISGPFLALDLMF